MRRIKVSDNFNRLLVRSYESPIGGPAPFGKKPRTGPVSEVGAHIDSGFTHRARARSPKKKIVSGKKSKGGTLTTEEQRRAKLLGPFMQFIKTKEENPSYTASTTSHNSPSMNDPMSKDHTTAPVGHDATPITRGDRRLFAGSFEAKGVMPIDSHRIRDETNYDHPAYKLPYERMEVDEMVPQKHNNAVHTAHTSESGTETLFHKLRTLSHQDIGHQSYGLPGVGSSSAFSGRDPMVLAERSLGDAAADDDETGRLTTSSAHSDDAIREAFSITTSASPGSYTHLKALGYEEKDLTLPKATTVPSNYLMGSRDGQLTPQRLIDLEMQRAEAEALHRGGLSDHEAAASSLNTLNEERSLGMADVFVAESAIYKPFSETNQRDRYSPTSTVLERHEVAKAVNTGVAAYVHHTAADMASRDRRAAAGDDLLREEKSLVKAQASSMVAHTATIFGSELDGFEKNFMDNRKASRQFPTLPSAFIHHPSAPSTDTIEYLGIDGKGSRVTRDKASNSIHKLSPSPEQPISLQDEQNPHFPDDDDLSTAANTESPLELRYFSSVPHGTRQMAPEDVERRKFVRLQKKVSESPGQLSYTKPTFSNDLDNTTINRHSLEDWWGEKATLAQDIESYRVALDGEGEDQTLYGEGTMDSVKQRSVAFIAAKYAMRYTHKFPKNEMIFDEYVTISKIIPTDGSAATVIPEEHRMKLRTGEARRIAKGMGLDLIKVGSLGKHSVESHALCIVADHRYDKREHIAFEMRRKGIGAPRVKECKEMPFRASIKPHDVWHKSFRVARLLLQGFPVRIWMKDIGGAGNGMAAFQYVLSEIKKESLKIKAYHTAGQVKMSDDLVEVILYPSTARTPKSDVIHPSDDELRQIRNHRVLEHEKEVHRDNLLEAATKGNEVSKYMRMLRDGTAWAYKDEGPSLKKLRDLKKTQGWLKKGNKELYSARGDVNLNTPFHASTATSVDQVNYPRVSNLEQATRGIAALAARADMDISEMHDRGETEDNEHTIQRFYYRVAGDALELGKFKEASGMKTNRRKLPAMGSGWATLGVEDDSEISAKNAAHFHGSQ